MFIAKIGVTGHRPSGFSNQSYAAEVARQVVDYCTNTFHGVEFNLGGCIGADSWVAEACIEHGVPFNLFLPFPADIQSAHWTEAQRASLINQIYRTKSVDVIGTTYNVKNYHIRDRKMVDNSHIMICFWEGRRSGGTYSTIRYALKTGKQVLNAMNELEEVIL